MGRQTQGGALGWRIAPLWGDPVAKPGRCAGLAIYVTNSWFRALARDTVDTSSPQ